MLPVPVASGSAVDVASATGCQRLLKFGIDTQFGNWICFLYIQSVSNYPRTFQFFVYCSHQCSFYIFFGANFRTKIRSVWVQWYIVYNVSSCTYIIFNNMRESKNLLLLVIKNHSLWRHTCRAPGTCRASSTWQVYDRVMVFMMLLLNIITIGFIHIFTRVTITIDSISFVINNHVLLFHHINYGVWFYLSKSVYIHFSMSIKVSEPLNWYVLIRDIVCYVTRLCIVSVDVSHALVSARL